MKRFVIWLLILLPVQSIFGQMVAVLNERTGTPVVQVLLYNPQASQTTLTDIRGRADLSLFQENEPVTFRHPSYQIRTLIKSAIPDTVWLTEKVIHTEQVVISANKWEQDITEIPQSIVAIESEDIRFRNPPTAADVLAQSGEVFVQKSQLGGGSPSLRGFAANAVLLVFDGVRMNNAIFRSGNLQNVISIDPLALEGVEVLMGSGSVIYGSDALGGVMDFHTIDPEFTSDDQVLFQPDFLVRYGTAAREKTVHGSFHLGGKRLAGFTSFSYNDFGDLKTGESLDVDYPEFGIYPFIVRQNNAGEDIVAGSDPALQEPTGYEALSILQKIRYQPRSGVELLYSFYHNQTGNVPRFDRLIETNDSDIPVFAEWYYGPQKWTMHSLRLTLDQKTSWYDRLRILPAYQHYKESRFDRRFGTPSLRSQQETLDILSLTLDADKALSLSTHLYVGLESVYNLVDSEAYRENSTTGDRTEVIPRYPDEGSDYSSSAVYASMTHTLSDSWVLSGGLRYTHVWLNASTSDSDAGALGARDISLSNGAVSGNAGVQWKLTGSQQLNFLLSSGFRAPNVDDVGKVFELDGNDLIIPNDELQPEKTYNTEISWRYNKGALRLETTVFYTWLKNAIVRGSATLNGMDSVLYNGQYFRLFSQVNAAEADIYGISFQGSYRITERFGVHGTLNVTDGEERESGEPLRHTTPVFGSLRTTFLLPRFKIEGWVDFNGNRFRENIPTSEIDSKPYLYAMHRTDRTKDGSPAWYTLNLRGSWQINPSFLLQVSLENMLDRHYRPYSSGISAPGRNIIMSLRITPRK